MRIVVRNPQRRSRRTVRARRDPRARGRARAARSRFRVLRDDENLPYVYVAAADGSFLRRVKLGARAGDRMEVVDGLRAGEQVVGAGSLFMQFAESQ